MRLLRSLLLAAARYSFTFSAQHVPGVTNQVADALFRFCLQEFRQFVPHAQPLPTPIPADRLDRLDRSALEQKWFSFLTHGFAPSTRRSYASAQAKISSFCQQLSKLHPSGSPCPTDEWTLCLFVTFLARTLQDSSIKVYLSGIRTLHIDQGFPDPPADCLRLQRVVRGIKRCQGAPSSTRLPITDALMLIIWQFLDLSLPDHVMFWAACSLGYFGFLRASGFTVPNLSSFSSSLHLSAQDIAVDSSSAPSSMHIRIKGYKTDPFRKGCFIHMVLASILSVPCML